MAYKIKFGTDGWREIIGNQFTVDNVKRVAQATAIWLKNNFENPSIVLGYDCRFGGEMFAINAAEIFGNNGIKVLLSNSFVSTPMISLACVKCKTSAGIIITASHNPPSYSGYKIKAHYGGPAVPAEIEKIETLIENEVPNSTHSFELLIENKTIEMVNLESIYLQHVMDNFDIPQLKNIEAKFAYDAMFGAGRSVVPKIFPNAKYFHINDNPGFEGRAPEPILQNLPEIASELKSEKFACGLATDGDADRIGFFDGKGNFVDSHHLILLLIEYLTTYKNFIGKVVKSFSVSDKIQKLCDLKNLETITTKIGFKYICEYMITDDVLIGAEESGGIAIKGHIPERDGVWMGLTMLEFIAKSGKSVQELIAEIYAKIGSFAVERYDLHITENLKHNIIEKCKNNAFTNFGEYKIQQVENVDGYKFRLQNETWVMIRPSGTEPVLRIYAEAENSAAAFAILDATKQAILN